MQLYWHPIAPPCRSVYLGLKLMKCEFEEHLIDVVAGEAKSEAYLKINPSGQIPFLVDGDVRLNESRAILIYLAESTKSDLYPANLKIRAGINQALFWDLEFWPKVRDVIYPALFEKDEALMMKALPGTSKYIAEFEAMISKERWACGEKITLADISIQGTISGLKILSKFGKSWAVELGVKQMKGIMGWHGNMKVLPGWMEFFEGQVHVALGIPVGYSSENSSERNAEKELKMTK